ncbi:zinc finger protein with KRAB and SCAN domains 8-like [Epinephelus fuscoguttatus]|uniref:zinc finger protein with KRAB and SCAN domains 8-like n=1 Tax=Epinephelus fuscoguttatus TaxID=293821 RepID=UPI0020CFFFF1|nr:zinc finger protein with KRAB and SCAN domains 8-like [Epinephelus fuscoguttatus]
MSSAEHLRRFVNERLTAAAEEIFGVFKKTIVAYEEEIDRQRRLLDIVWNPEIKLLRIEPPQHQVGMKEDVLADQQDPEPPQIKEELEELCTSQEGEQLELKQETDTLILTPTSEGNDHSEAQSLYFPLDKSLSAADTEPPASVCITWQNDESDSEDSDVSDPKNVHQLLFHNFLVAQSQHQNVSEHGESGSTSNVQPDPQKSHTHYLINTNLSGICCNTGKKFLKCDTCEKTFRYRSDLQRHLLIHTGEKPYSCNMCGKRFNQKARLSGHMRIHTGEKPYSCKTCGKYFRHNSQLTVHMRGHTGEKPFTCNTCGKDFRRSDELAAHIRRIH